MSYGWAAGAVLAVSVAQAAPPRILTQEQAIGLAMEQNADLARAALEVRRQELGRDEARESIRGLRIRPTGDTRASDRETVVEAGLRAVQPIPLGADLAVSASARRISLRQEPHQHEARLAVEISQPLFRRFGRRVREAPLDEADARLAAERRRWTAQRSELVVDVVRLYEEILWTLRRIEADEAFRDRIEALHAVAAARERQGQAGRLDVMKLELQRGEAELRLRAGEDRLDVLRLEFCERLGLPLETDFDLEPAPVPDVPAVGAAEAVAVAYGWRMEYAQALDDLGTSRRRLALARRALQPDLMIQARYEWSDLGRRWSDAVSLGDDAWAVGLGWNLDLRREQARLSAGGAEVDLEVNRRRLDLVRLRIARDVHARLLAHRRALAERDMAARNRRLAGDRAELARTLYGAGRGDAFTVSDSEDALLQSDLAWLGLRRDAAVTAYEFLHALGTLVEPPEDLRPVDPEDGEVSL